MTCVQRFSNVANEAARTTNRANLPSPGACVELPELDSGYPAVSAEGLTIVHLYPELLNLYGDAGNVTVLANRARWRGLKVDVVRVSHGDDIDLSHADVVFLGGGPDREQRLASLDLIEQAHVLRDFVEDDGVLLAICGGYQILGTEWLLGDESVPGLGILDIATKRAAGGSHNRLVGNVALESPIAKMPVIGYENHAGRTYLGKTCVPFGRVIGKHGKGNNDDDAADGVLYRSVMGTYLHGPVLSKNPEVADWLIGRALARRAAKEGAAAPALQLLNDAEEYAATAFMCRKLRLKQTPNQQS
ncbi:MAG: glutamine amidotransferase [Eggerthellaceae bacterium]|nr:glutamine amidotransferase [Eggerthellaceae bacterium]